MAEDDPSSVPYPTASVHRSPDPSGDHVGAVARLYLGNVLYAIELAATSLDAEDRREEAAFYRGIARQLAEARGRERPAAQPPARLLG